MVPSQLISSHKCKDAPNRGRLTFQSAGMLTNQLQDTRCQTRTPAARKVPLPRTFKRKTPKRPAPSAAFAPGLVWGLQALEASQHSGHLQPDTQLRQIFFPAQLEAQTGKASPRWHKANPREPLSLQRTSPKHTASVISRAAQLDGRLHVAGDDQPIPALAGETSIRQDIEHLEPMFQCCIVKKIVCKNLCKLSKTTAFLFKLLAFPAFESLVQACAAAPNSCFGFENLPRAHLNASVMLLQSK